VRGIVRRGFHPRLARTAIPLRIEQDVIPHKGVAELRAKRGRPAKAPEDRKEQIALRVDP